MRPTSALSSGKKTKRSFQIQHELKQRYEAVDLMRKQYLQRLEYEATTARRRNMQVDPNNRLVADTLEADWNTKLRAVQEAQEDYKHVHSDGATRLFVLPRAIWSNSCFNTSSSSAPDMLRIISSWLSSFFFQLPSTLPRLRMTNLSPTV
jgi:hypothetical protein